MKGLPRQSSIRNSLRSRMSQRAFGPCLGHLDQIDLVAEHTHQLGSSRQARCRHHPFTALQTTRYPIHHDLPRSCSSIVLRNVGSNVVLHQLEESREAHAAEPGIASYRRDTSIVCGSNGGLALNVRNIFSKVAVVTMLLQKNTGRWSQRTAVPASEYCCRHTKHCRLQQCGDDRPGAPQPLCRAVGATLECGMVFRRAMPSMRRTH